MNLIEKEILRASCYYSFYNTIYKLLNKNFNLNEIKAFRAASFDNEYNLKVRTILIRWFFILVQVRKEENDSVFICERSIDLENQIKIDIINFFQENNPKNINLIKFSEMLIEVIYYNFKEYENIINTTKINTDNNVIIKEKERQYNENEFGTNILLTYESPSINVLNNDKYVKIEKDKKKNNIIL
jgi:hypothetical protein